jgi:Ca-activated chloride channel family protein
MNLRLSKIVTFALAAVGVVFGATSARAQYRGEVQVEAVVVPVTVRDGQGRVVSKVSHDRFSLSVDGHKVPIRHIAREFDLPLSLGFVLDTSGSMAGRKMEACQQLIMAFLAERRREDQIALWTFGDDRVLERFPFGMGWYMLPRILETLRPWSTTALYDMVQRFPEVMEEADHPRRAVLLLTDGVDNASAMSHEGATTLARDLVTPVYVVGVEPPPEPIGASGPSYEQVLTLIADESGGRYRRIPRVEDMPEVVHELLEELSSRFIVTFTTSGLGKRTWRPLDVEVEGYRAIARRGYVGTLP